MGGKERDRGALKSALVVAGGLALAWVTMETAFKPWLDRLRTSVARSDPATDPDDADETAAAAPYKAEDSKDMDDAAYAEEDMKVLERVQAPE
ncbi:hypothetical protein KSP40_PGU018627 [Platanthera guangdongensis]|uniref:Outer envelope membrane protein 7 n=1 Tax=Platanthera guangdongensis TaxID=2320717 RepID=A0ABR2N570_9ASPA